MPIEFTCNNCNKMLRVPEGTEGKACQCPACGSVSTVPKASGSSTASASAGSETGQHEKAQDDGLVRVTCPQCQYPLRCKPELMGSKGQCKQCKHIFVIGDTSVAAVEKTSLVFSCPKCNQLFDGKPEMEGRKGKCHSCGEVFPIKLRQAETDSKPKIEKSVKSAATPSVKRSSSTPSTAPGSTSNSSAAKSKSTSNMQLICGSCKGVMEVPSSAAGKNVACPHCQQLLQVPSPKSSSSSAKPSIFDQPSTPLFDSGPRGSTSSGSSGGIFDGLDVPTSGPSFPSYPASPSPGAYASNPSPPSYQPSAYQPAAYQPTAYQPTPYAPSYPSSGYQNPYQSPYQAPPSALQQAAYSERGGDRDWLRSVADWHRRLAMSIAICIGCYAALFAGGFILGMISGPNSGPPGLPPEPPLVFTIFIFVFGLVAMAAGLMMLVSYIVLCTKVYEGGTAALYIVGYFVGACVPFLPLILLIVTLNKAAGVLRSYGITVGFFGADTSDI